MSDNRTVDTAEQVLDWWVTWDYELENVADKIFFLKAMEEYKDQQTASLREELNNLRGHVDRIERDSREVNHKLIASQEEANSLREENERLKEKMLAFFKAAEYQNMDDFLLRGKLGDFIKLGSLTSVRTKELQEEVERYRLALKEISEINYDHNDTRTNLCGAIWTAKNKAIKALSGKESKTDK